ncbi:MAG TPA: hypothetical protein VII06_41130 [Chloroflexota bacterium]
MPIDPRGFHTPHEHAHNDEHDWGPEQAAAATKSEIEALCDFMMDASKDPDLEDELVNNTEQTAHDHGVPLTIDKIKALLHLPGTTQEEFKRCLKLRLQQIRQGKAHASGLSCGCG